MVVTEQTIFIQEAERHLYGFRTLTNLFIQHGCLTGTERKRRDGQIDKRVNVPSSGSKSKEYN